jgi:hypothetical protein
VGCPAYHQELRLQAICSSADAILYRPCGRHDLGRNIQTLQQILKPGMGFEVKHRVSGRRNDMNGNQIRTKSIGESGSIA